MTKYFNLIVTLTNLVAVVPINYAYNHNMHFDMILLILVMCASMLHHISGNNRGLEAILFTSHYNNLLLLDRIIAFITIVRMIYLIYSYEIYNKFVSYDNLLISVSLLGLLYSDVFLGKYNTFREKMEYCFTHSLWHITAFLFVNQILQ